MSKQWIDKKDKFETLDARQANPIDFFPAVTGKAQSMPEGEGLHIIQSFEPVPLYAVLGGMGFEHETIPDDNGDFHVYFYKTPTSASATTPSEAEMVEGKSLSTKMGGHLNLKPERVQAIVGIVQAFYDGEDVTTLRQRFETEIKSISPVEFAFVEQKMTELGVSDAQFKARVEDLLMIFKKSLQQAETPDFPEGHPIHTFKLENEMLAKLVEEMRAAGSDRGAAWWQDAFAKLWQVNTHYVRKENQLFPLLEQKGFDKPSKVMWALHDDIRAAIKHARKLLDDGDINGMLAALDAALDGVIDMTFKESKILWPTSLAMLQEGEWAAVRRGEEELGYCLIDPPPAWPPEAAVEAAVEAAPAAPPAKKPLAVGAIGLEEGYLTPEQISLVLQHLPLDITFMDEFDEVRYANHGKQTAVAHEEAIDAFKEGTQDAVESWGEDDGRFLHQKTIAVRDADGNYKGVLGVKQDITDIRALEGERRILDWK